MAIVIMILLVFDLGLMAYAGVKYTNANKTLDGLENAVDNLEERVVNDVTHLYLAEPDMFFKFIDEHPEWEEIDAVPYSRCYRHLIGTTTADFIFCQAI